MSTLEPLLQRAFHTVAAADANEAMARLREERGSETAVALSYEAVIPDRADLVALAEKLLPRLVYFLDCRGAPLPRAPGVFVSLFHGAQLHFLEVQDVIEVLGQAWGTTPEALVARYGAASADAGS